MQGQRQKQLVRIEATPSNSFVFAVKGQSTGSYDQLTLASVNDSVRCYPFSYFGHIFEFTLFHQLTSGLHLH